MNPDNVSAFQNLESLTKIRQREVFCHIAKVTALTTPLIASDDLMLKTTMASVGIYDRELSKIIYKHTSFPDIESEGQKITFDQFLMNMSFLDPQVLLWGIFDATYGSLGKREIKCPFCDNAFDDDIQSEQLLQDDSLIAWEHESAFTDYEHRIEKIIDVPNIYKLEFVTKLPSIKRHLEIVSLLSEESIQSNFDQFGSLFSKVEELTSVTTEIKVYKTADDEAPDVFSTIEDIYFVINNFLLLLITSEVLRDFNNHFSKYIPTFKKPYTCGECGKDFDFFVDMEISLFRRFLEED